MKRAAPDAMQGVMRNMKMARSANLQRASGADQSARAAINKVSESFVRMPGVRNKIRSKILQVGKPLYTAARAGLRMVNKIDDKLEGLEDKNIPFLSDAITAGRSHPVYKAADKYVEDGEKYLDKGVGVLKKFDKASEIIANGIGQTGQMIHRN